MEPIATEDLSIVLGEEGQAVELGLLGDLGGQLRAVFRKIWEEAGGQALPQVRFAVVDAEKGSLRLRLRPEIEGEGGPTPARVARTLIEDIEAIGESRPRADMSADLFHRYRALIETGRKAGRLSIEATGGAVVLDRSNALRYEAAFEEERAANVVLAGHIETLNIHRRPWNFGLYTKLDRQRVECRFADDMLKVVTALMEENAMAEVVGEAVFGRIGLTPRLIELGQPPKRLEFDPEALLGFARRFDITRPGETAADAVARIREERADYG
jgi:hypothetical protein